MAIQFLRGNASTLQSSQQVFLPGQPIFEQDTGKLKIGNGSDVYSALSYVGESGGVSSQLEVISNEDDSQHYVDLSPSLRLAFGYSLLNYKFAGPTYGWKVEPWSSSVSESYFYTYYSSTRTFNPGSRIFGFLDSDNYKILSVNLNLCRVNFDWIVEKPLAVTLSVLGLSEDSKFASYSIWGDAESLQSSDTALEYVSLVRLL